MSKSNTKQQHHFQSSALTLNHGLIRRTVWMLIIGAITHAESLLTRVLSELSFRVSLVADEENSHSSTNLKIKFEMMRSMIGWRCHEETNCIRHRSWFSIETLFNSRSSTSIWDIDIFQLMVQNLNFEFDEETWDLQMSWWVQAFFQKLLRRSSSHSLISSWFII